MDCGSTSQKVKTEKETNLGTLSPLLRGASLFSGVSKRACPLQVHPQTLKYKANFWKRDLVNEIFI